MQAYLDNTDIVDWQTPEVLQKAQSFALPQINSEEVAGACFHYVRDEIKHSNDHDLNPVTCKASEVLHHGHGFCYAKSHLLVALLRANNIPAGFCYQRLSVNENGAPYSLHGLVAVYLDGCGWYRIDPRGNKAGINAAFSPPDERLAFSVNDPEEFDLPHIWAVPLPVVIEALNRCHSIEELRNNLPDININDGLNDA